MGQPPSGCTQRQCFVSLVRTGEFQDKLSGRIHHIGTFAVMDLLVCRMEKCWGSARRAGMAAGRFDNNRKTASSGGAACNTRTSIQRKPGMRRDVS